MTGEAPVPWGSAVGSAAKHLAAPVNAVLSPVLCPPLLLPCTSHLNSQELGFSLADIYDLSRAACEHVALLTFVTISGIQFLVAAATEDARHGEGGFISSQTSALLKPSRF